MTGIWQRYYLKEAIKVFSLLLFSFYFLYMLIDYAFHAHIFTNKDFPFTTIGQYYLCHISKRAYILIPFSLMIATLKVLTSSNQNNEIVALMAGGISAKKIILPFVLFATLCSSLLYVNTQWVQPHATQKLEKIEETFFKKSQMNKEAQVNTLNLLDGTHLIYRKYDSVNKAFNDVYWVRSVNDIYRIKVLHLDLSNQSTPQADFVDHLVSNEVGELTAKESFQTKAFNNIQFEETSLQTVLVPPQEQSITQLIHSYYKTKKSQRSATGEILGVLNYKLALPLICFIVVITTAPYCLRYGRNFPLFSIYALSIIGFVIFFMIMQATCVLAENHVTSPIFTIWLPVLALLIPFSYKSFVKKT